MKTRNTTQKQIIAEALQSLHGTHPTALDVFNAVTQSHPTISKSTVYRVLRDFASCGVITQIERPKELERYDDNPLPHSHFRCRHCHTIFDIDDTQLATLASRIGNTYGHQVQALDLTFSGICAKCK
ncbi:MAG: transcriptional repressor [Firmicutes bacterium]|nr:transcriptional repressor [Bacillota bacterium]